MTGTNDQDRRIAAWFEDVPSRIPDRTIDAVLAHARTHPRRRDRLAALRRDPMGSGGFRGEPAIVPPVVTPSPAPSASATPSPSKSPATIRVDLIEHLGNDAFVNVTDESFTLIGALSGDPGDGVDVSPDQIRIENDPTDPDTIVLTWAGETCDTSHDLVIGSDGRALALTRPACEGDLLGGVGHVLRLTFDAPAPAAEFDATLVTTP